MKNLYATLSDYLYLWGPIFFTLIAIAYLCLRCDVSELDVRLSGVILQFLGIIIVSCNIMNRLKDWFQRLHGKQLLPINGSVSLTNSPQKVACEISTTTNIEERLSLVEKNVGNITTLCNILINEKVDEVIKQQEEKHQIILADFKKTIDKIEKGGISSGICLFVGIWLATFSSEITIFLN